MASPAEGIGLGDVKLAGVAGAWLDWMTLAIVVEAAALVAVVAYALRRIDSKRRFRAVDRLPLGFYFRIPRKRILNIAHPNSRNCVDPPLARSRQVRRRTRACVFSAS